MNLKTAFDVGLRSFAAITVIAIGNPGPSLVNGDDETKQSSKPKRDFAPRTVLRKPIRAIRDAKFIAAADVTNEVSDNELVLGVVVKGDARAYPINMLTGPSREIINDMLGGTAIAATW